MGSNILRILAILLALVNFSIQLPNERPGKCPVVVEDCQDGEGIPECQMDEDCTEDFKCCTRGCTRTCLSPLRTGCEQLRRQLVRQPLGDGFVPVCRPDGEFELVQCNGDDCWCVDGRGFELAGTRARSIDTINCTRPKGCAGYLCRMLCPYGFELDNRGCPLCECRNPCKRVQCPSGHECHLEDVPCSKEPCPPLPTCKRPRNLDGQCPRGEPIVSPDTKNPFLCGVQPNKPQCPANYICNVMPGNDYGICCPLFDKPGLCPSGNATLVENSKCPTPCRDDSSCPDVGKCCDTETCGRSCLRPINATLCQQQRAVVKLLLGTNPDYAAYIPQCTEDGEFAVKQCTTNGKLCWCVEKGGTQVRGSLGPAETVTCLMEETQVRENGGVVTCPEIVCAAECPLGYKKDVNGCQLCVCADPCKEIACPLDAECMILKEEPCVSGDCPPIATCIRRSPENVCKEGTTPLTIDGKVRNCSHNDCPQGFNCRLLPDSDMGICCPLDSQPALETMCPEIVARPDTCQNITCKADDECLDGRKCCPEASCGSVCVFPKPARLPTMCEYLREMSLKVGNETLAIPVPACRADGSYEPVQCDGAPCWCVDEFGTELPGSRVENGEKVNCNEARALKPCLGLLCRLGCDYGFEMDDRGCPICECRNPCAGAKCSTGRICQMIAPLDCRGGWCPSVPHCVSNDVEGRIPLCPVGQPMLYEENNMPVTCDPEAEYQQCPVTHSCVSESKLQRGVCCPRLDEDRLSEASETRELLGQCPYLIKPAGGCDFECGGDSECEKGLRCCSNGCGTRCTTPLLFTACQHRKYTAQKMRDLMIAPSCNQSDGSFETRQCDKDGHCWCVDSSGNQVPGLDTDCSKTDCRPLDNCLLDCAHGLEIGEDGCHVCACRNPCKDVKCKNDHDTCQTVSVTCTSQPCPPIVMCLPPAENPCSTGEPLPDHRCSPTEDLPCPSSHHCYINPLVPLADGFCCPKPTKESECEQIRQRNLKIRKNYNKVVYVPKCNKKTGEWEPIQCLETVGLCWCVDPQGHQVSGSVVRGTPSCNSLRAARQFEQTPICPNGEVVHSCPADLCNGATCVAHPDAICRIDPCGSCTARFYDSRNRLLDCSHGLTACLAEVDRVLESASWPERHRRPVRSIFQEEDETFTLESRQVELPSGRPITMTSGIAIVMGPRIRSMLGHLKTIMAETAIKPGVCPPPSLLTMLRSLSWQCRHSCMLDGHCPSSKKCCLGSCGMECTDPLETSEPPVLMSAMPPNCSSEGGYAVVQKQEQLSWCVDKYGEPFHHTLTRGSVGCFKNGTVVHKKEKGPVCPDSDTKPLVCRNQCLEASCHQHPEAVCVADPCDGCAVHFLNHRGAKVDCQDKCRQPVQKGSCDGRETRFAYVPRDGRCQEFKYSGCEGNDNNFASEEDCRSQCEKPRPVCQQPKETGMCRAFWVRWFYNRNTHRCEKFVYGGCGGNDNNFATKEQCQAICPDIVYCPWAAVDEELKGCSRTEACTNTTCLGHPEAICTVDPCVCHPTFVNAKGHPVDCQNELPRLVVPDVTSMTLCQYRSALKDSGAPQCAANGTFLPKQCSSRGHCWCVDEAGTQIPNADPDHCQFVPIKRVEVTVNMESEDKLREGHLVATETKELANRLLERLSVEPPRDLVVEDRAEGNVRLTFTLLDDNKVDAAFKLEEMVKNSGLKLMLTQGTLIANYKNSHFYYVADYTPTLSNSITESRRAGTSSDGNVVVALVLVGTLSLVLLLLVALVLYRRSRDQETGGRSLVTLMFNSPLYDFVTRKTQTKEDDEVKKPPVEVATVESEYESIQNQVNSAKLPPAYLEVESKDESHA